MTVKEKIKELKHSRFIVNRLLFRLIQQVWKLSYIFTDGSYRYGILTRIRYGSRYHQQVTFTTQNRYPLVFQACADYLATVANPRILSFGCSTGEELISIGAYIPGAQIMGIDINHWCLRQCQKRNKNPRFSFHHRFSKEFEISSGFDAIFCMAVFQRTENRTNSDNSLAQGFLFEQFEAEVAYLDKKLKNGGLFIIDQADFSFTDTVCAKNYDPIPFEKNLLERHRPLFDRNNQKVGETQSFNRVFAKHGSFDK